MAERKSYTRDEAKKYLATQREKAKEYSAKHMSKNRHIGATIPKERSDAVDTVSGKNASKYIRELIEEDLKKRGLI
jgi:hypothetical protein